MAYHRVADVLAGKMTGQQARLRGWVHRQRTGGKIAFIWLRDGTGVVQCTVKMGTADDASLEAAKGARIEASVALLEGEVVADERAPGGHEVRVARFELHRNADDFPLRGEQGTEFELDNRHLWLRSTELSAVFRIKHRLYKAIRDFFDGNGFAEVDPSVITTNACEGGSTLFTFDYFGQTAYLSQSAQMYLEGLIFGLPKVYSVTPSFRAEKSRTSKHLTEFHHLEAEAAWWRHEDNLEFQERLVTYLAHDLAAHCGDELRTLGQDPARLGAVRMPFVRMTYDDAVVRLNEMGYKFAHGDDFGAPHEKALGEEEDLTQGGTSPFFLTHWPVGIKAFYMAEDPQRPGYVRCADLMAPGGFGEIIGGSERSENIESMADRLWAQFVALRDSKDPAERKEAEAQWKSAKALVHEPHEVPEGLSAAERAEYLQRADLLAPYAWYFDLRRYGSVPHSGFGLGIERLLRWFTGQEHIRDMLPYPRTPSRAYP
jgi:asparaginyl-tRNA synthetase